jgi:hypothetical protein
MTKTDVIAGDTEQALASVREAGIAQKLSS